MFRFAVMGLATADDYARMQATGGAFLPFIAGRRSLSDPAHQFQYQ